MAERAPIAELAAVLSGLILFTFFFVIVQSGAGTRSVQPSAPALSEGQEARDYYRGLPPPEFRGEWTGTVRFVDDVKALCGPDAYACAQGGVIIMPNPCTPDALASVGWYYADGSLKMLKSEYSWSVEEYRTTMCHEIGHVNGWPGSHWIATETEIEQIAGEMVEELYERDQVYGATPRDNLVKWRSYGLKGDAAIAKLIAERAVSEDRFNDTYSEIRLDPCKYWTMRQEREGDGSKRMKKWCPDA